MSEPLQIGVLIFPKVTQLDFTGPVQVFSNMPGAKVHMIWKRIEPVESDAVLTLTPTVTFADCPQLDVICVPGGFGTNDMVNDEEMLAFLRKQAPGAKYVTSVCTGSLILGAAGLLNGCSATTRRTAIGAEAQAPLALLAGMGARPRVAQIVDASGPITGGGVSLAHDLTLHLIGRLYGEAARDEVARLIEYDRAFAANRAALGFVTD